jgi:hypothetical protein
VRATIFPHDADEGVSLWFSGQRLLTDGTSENSSTRNCLENVEGGVSAVLFADVWRQKRASLPFLSTHGSVSIEAIRNFQTVSLGTWVNKGIKKGREPW